MERCTLLADLKWVRWAKLTLSSAGFPSRHNPGWVLTQSCILHEIWKDEEKQHNVLALRVHGRFQDCWSWPSFSDSCQAPLGLQLLPDLRRQNFYGWTRLLSALRTAQTSPAGCALWKWEAWKPWRVHVGSNPFSRFQFCQFQVLFHEFLICIHFSFYTTWTSATNFRFHQFQKHQPPKACLTPSHTCVRANTGNNLLSIRYPEGPLFLIKSCMIHGRLRQLQKGERQIKKKILLGRLGAAGFMTCWMKSLSDLLNKQTWDP